jgi:hypothetical protein
MGLRESLRVGSGEARRIAAIHQNAWTARALSHLGTIDQLIAAEFSYEPVESLGCDIVDVAIASAGHARDRESVSHFLSEVA